MRQYTPTTNKNIWYYSEAITESNVKTQNTNSNTQFLHGLDSVSPKPQTLWTMDMYETISKLWMNMKMKTNESFSKSRSLILNAAEWNIELELNAKFEFEFSIRHVYYVMWYELDNRNHVFSCDWARIQLFEPKALNHFPS